MKKYFSIWKPVFFFPQDDQFIKKLFLHFPLPVSLFRNDSLCPKILALETAFIYTLFFPVEIFGADGADDSFVSLVPCLENF